MPLWRCWKEGASRSRSMPVLKLNFDMSWWPILRLTHQESQSLNLGGYREWLRQPWTVVNLLLLAWIPGGARNLGGKAASTTLCESVSLFTALASLEKQAATMKSFRFSRYDSSQVVEDMDVLMGLRGPPVVISTEDPRTSRFWSSGHHRCQECLRLHGLFRRTVPRRWWSGSAGGYNDPGGVIGETSSSASMATA